MTSYDYMFSQTPNTTVKNVAWNLEIVVNGLWR